LVILLVVAYLVTMVTTGVTAQALIPDTNAAHKLGRRHKSGGAK